MAKKLTAFQVWWGSPRRPFVDSRTPHDIARLAFEAGRRSIPAASKLQRGLEDMLDMLGEWDGGFDGFHAVNRAEKLTGRTLSKVR